MKKLILTVVAGIVSVATFAQNWNMDKAHSNVSFSVTHLLISEVDGKFGGFDAKLTSAGTDFQDASFDFTADVKSINTGNDMRDKDHLQSAGWFDSAKYPTITFKSTSVKKVSGNKYTIMGNITMHGVTKPLTLNATINGPIENARSKKMMMGVKALGTVDRSAFGVGSAGGAVSNEVEFKVAGEFVKE